jgi:asparagine N-glycosylation enzyme membrane subunit Stt3
VLLLLTLLLVMAVAVAVRVDGTAALHLAGGGVRPVSSDAHYYLRQITATYAEFPAVPDLDRGLGCPQDAVPPWPGGVERLGAALALILLPGDASALAVEGLAAWLPVASGALTAAASAALGWAWLGPLAGLLAGLLLALLPLHIWYTAYSFVDHHMLIPLWIAAATLAVDRLLDSPQPRRIAVLAAVVALGHAFLTEAWILQLVVATAAVATALTALPEGPERRRTLGALLLALGLGSLLAVPFIAAAPYSQHGLVAPHAPSRFTLWILCAFCAALGAGWLALGPGASKRTRAVAAALTAAAAVLALAMIADPPMKQALFAVLGFSGRGGMVASIEESKPFWRQPMPQPLLVLGGAVLLLPLLPLGFTGLPPLRRRWLTLLLAATAALALLQTRFALALAVPYVLAWAGILTLRSSRWPRSLAGLGALAALALLPPRLNAEHWSAHEESVWRMLVWMRDKLPPPAADGPRCLLGPWDVGHKILHVTGQPVVASNFTELRERQALRDAMAVLMAGDFAAAEPLLQARQVRYVWAMATPWAVLEANATELGMAPLDLPAARAMVGTRLLLDAGSGFWRGAQAVQAGGTLRRLHVSPLELSGLWQGRVRGPLREIALFERVAGALLVGQAGPGAQVTARATVKHPGAPAFAFAQVGLADATGKFALRVPYASQGMKLGVALTAPWQVQVGDGVAVQVDVPESAVQSGAEVPVAAP